MYCKNLNSHAKFVTHSPQTSRKGPPTAKVEIDAPKYLKYDLEKKQLKEPSEYEKDAYIRKLVRMYSKFNERQTMDKKIEKIQNPADFT